MAAAIDTLKLAKRLREADFTEVQAEALAEAGAEATVENVATKLDIAELRAELKQDIADLDAKYESLRAELKQDIASLDAKYDRVTAELKVEIAALESRMLRWMGVGFAATIVVPGALIQFAHH